MTDAPQSPQSPPEAGAATAEPPSFSFRMLQFAVWGMGLLLFFGIMGLAFTVVARKKGQEPVPLSAQALPQALAPARLEPFDTETLPLPSGARVRTVTLDGTVMVLHLTWSDGLGEDGGSGGLLWFYDVADKKVLGEFKIP